VLTNQQAQLVAQWEAMKRMVTRQGTR
jgi:hypothetical protein